jgi:hypothetical protein
MGEGRKRTYQVGNAAGKLFAFRAPLVDYEIRFPAQSRRRGPREAADFLSEKRTIE